MPDDSREHWKRLESLVDGALDLPESQRAEFLNEACGNDYVLREEAETWLAACDDPSRFPDTAAAIFAASLVSPDAERTQGNELSGMHRIGPYRIVRELGRGGMGAVFLAERDDGQLEHRVAIKVMRRGTGNDEHLRRRFLDERQILARLEHPNIATLLDGGVTPDGRLYFVMQFVEGTPIDRYCDERNLSIDERLRIFLTVCGAVEHAHRHQVVHRDLKPGNIMVRHDGHAKLLDFGIAKLLEPPTPRPDDVTRTGERLLTPEYASPEQIRGDTVTPASDVHALGVLLHRLLTGQRPFRRKAGSPHELERAILEDEPTQPSDAVNTPAERRRLRGDLDAIVLTALRKDPAERYASAGALAEDIDRHLKRLPVRARGRAPTYRLRAFASRYRASLLGTAAGMLLGAVLLATWPSANTSSRSAGNSVMAIGRIIDYRDGGSSDASAAPLVDMLATNLARARGLAVISAGRMYELVHQSGAGEVTGETHLRAARLAGATEILNGAIFGTAGGGVRLDLQRVDIASGTILGAHTATGADLFALADSVTARLVAGLGLTAPPGSIADVTTRSLAAYGHYVEGVRQFIIGDQARADASFRAALEEDSTFAMAAYYYARNHGYQWRYPSATSSARVEFEERFARAQRLARNVSDRERLMIRTYYETFHLSPDARALAETLAVRYPQEIEGHLTLGISLVMQGDIRPAMSHFMRVLAMDSASLETGADNCAGCVAIDALIEANVVLDSLTEAERYSRLWLNVQPRSFNARGRLVQVLDAQGRHTEAATVLRSGPVGGSTLDSVIAIAKHLIRSGELATADSVLRVWLDRIGPQERAPLLYFHSVVLRHQGRASEALVVGRRLRRMAGEQPVAGAAPPAAMVEAQCLYELGRFGAAGLLFDSIARWSTPGQPPSAQATFRVQALSMAAAARYAAGDTGGLAAMADSLERDGQRALMFRSRIQHHFVRGLLLLSRGDQPGATRSLEGAVGPLTSDFGRANLELAGIHLASTRPAEAIAVLRPATRGWFLETTNLHVSLTEVHERLAQALELAGQSDSALTHWKRVADSWSDADAPLAERRAQAIARIDALTRRSREGDAPSATQGYR